MRNSYRSCGCCKQNNNNSATEAVTQEMPEMCPIMPTMNNCNSCDCGFDDDDNKFPSNPMYGQSYVPLQTLNKVFTPEVGLKMGTIFPELVSPYRPNQSIEEIEWIRANNTIGEGCNR